MKTIGLLDLFFAGRESPELLSDAVATLVFMATVMLLRALFSRLVRGAQSVSEQPKLRWTVQLRWLSYLLIGGGVLVIWSTELRTMAVGVMAFAVAIVIATKELVLCVLGAILRASSKAFTVGDRIEIDGIRGDVIDHGLLATTVLEIGPGLQRTGRAVTIPNSQLLSKSVVNETFTDAYVLHVIRIPLNFSADWRGIERAVLNVAQEVCKDFLPEARNYMEKSAKLHGLASPVVEPRVAVEIENPDELLLLLRVPTPARKKGRTEQRILKKLLQDHIGLFGHSDALKER
ncbi:MAG: mechanosensitive ion channel family protein [Myxococcales bacterium]|nr:MAG: mechanosensitive ion channel family protein [Myxococcales bacterium]